MTKAKYSTNNHEPRTFNHVKSNNYQTNKIKIINNYLLILISKKQLKSKLMN